MNRQYVMTIGTFDGVHLGHRKLLDSLKKMACAQGAECAALALERPARSIIRNNLHDLLTPWNEKAEILKSAGIKKIFKIRFDKKFSRISAEDFFYRILKIKHKIKGLAVGSDFKFGRGAKGGTKMLAKLCRSENVAFKEVDKLKIGGEVISSTRIRNLLLEGSVQDANRLLGYKYTIRGRIYRDQGLGSKLGAPTLNIMPDKHKILPTGVFAAELTDKGSTYRALCYIGTRPTIRANGRSKADKKVEVHIPNHIWSSKSKVVSVALVRKIRGEIKFKSLDELCEGVKSLLLAFS